MDAFGLPPGGFEGFRSPASERNKAPPCPDVAPARGSALLEAIRDASARQIVHGQLNGHFIARQDLDVMHAHLAGDMGQNLMTVLKLHLEHSVGQCFENRAFEFDNVLLRQVSSLFPYPDKAAAEYYTQHPLDAHEFHGEIHDGITKDGANAPAFGILARHGAFYACSPAHIRNFSTLYRRC